MVLISVEILTDGTSGRFPAELGAAFRSSEEEGDDKILRAESVTDQREGHTDLPGAEEGGDDITARTTTARPIRPLGCGLWGAMFILSSVAVVIVTSSS